MVTIDLHSVESMLEAGVQEVVKNFGRSFDMRSLYAKFGRMICARKVFDEMTHMSRVSWTALICGYARSGDMGNTRRLFFYQMPDKDSAAFKATIDDRYVVSWTSMISGYSHHGDIHSARSLFDAMPKKNPISWNAMIGAIADLGALDLGCWVEKVVRRKKLDRITNVGTALVNMY
ncbi:hypothetical protein ACFX2I_040432 [Malus domestica]